MQVKVYGIKQFLGSGLTILLQLLRNLRIVRDKWIIRYFSNIHQMGRTMAWLNKKQFVVARIVWKLSSKLLHMMYVKDYH